VIRRAALLLTLLLAACASTSDMSKVNYSLDEQLRLADGAYREARLDDAERLYRSITESHPDLKDVWFRLGNIYTRQDQLDAAIRAYQRSLQLDPSDGRAWYNLSLVHMKQAVGTLEVASHTLPPDSPYRERIAALHDSLMARAKGHAEDTP
jgi:tetratricopeptide (TPR) repeat protein